MFGRCLRYIIMPICGPTCKIARFEAKLKFSSRTECGKRKFIILVHPTQAYQLPGRPTLPAPARPQVNYIRLSLEICYNVSCCRSAMPAMLGEPRNCVLSVWVLTPPCVGVCVAVLVMAQPQPQPQLQLNFNSTKIDIKIAIHHHQPTQQKLNGNIKKRQTNI